MVLVELLLDVLRDVLLHGVLVERLAERTREKKFPQTPTKNQLSTWGQRGDGNQIESRKEEREGGHAARTMRAISKASCRISSFMSALLSWILCAAAAAAAAGGGDPAPTGLRSSEEARSAACAAPPAPRLASSDILGGGWSGAAGHGLSLSRNPTLAF